MPSISIHAPLAGRDSAGPFFILRTLDISLHAPLAGRDFPALYSTQQCFYFNPRAPCGARRGASYFEYLRSKFQSTRPLRGATSPPFFLQKLVQISIHAPLAGRDDIAGVCRPRDDDFNPRAPCGARQQKCTNCFAHFCDNRQVLSKFAQNAACQGILIPFPFRKSLQIWVRTARAISARLRFAL